MNYIMVRKMNLLNKNILHSVIIKIGTKICDLLKKLNDKKSNKYKEHNVNMNQYVNQKIDLNNVSAYSTQAIQSLFQIICNGQQQSESIILPKSVQQYLFILKQLQTLYSLPITINKDNYHSAREIQLLYVLYHQNMISYVNPTAPINNNRVRSTYNYLTQNVKHNKYCKNRKLFYKRLYQTIIYNENHINQ